MFDIKLYEEKIANEPELQKAIQELVNFTIKEKKFKYKVEELFLDCSLLITNNILIQSGAFIEVCNSALFHFEFFQQYSSKYGFILTENINEVFLFVEKIEEELTSGNSFNSGIFSFFRNFNSFIVFHVQKQFKGDFNQYIHSLNKESGEVLYEFNSAYCEIVPYILIPINVLFDNLKHLMEILTSDSTFDSNTGAIGNAIRKYCIFNIESGKQMLQYSIDNQSPVIHNLNIPMLGGIYEIEREAFWEKIVQFYKSEENEVSIICALASVKALSNEEAKRYYELIISVSDPKVDSLVNLPKFYCSIINNDNISDPNLKKQCFDKLADLIVNPNQNVRGNTLWEIGFIVEYDIETVELLKSLILTEDFEKNQLKAIGNALIKHKHLQSFIDFIHVYAEKFKIIFEVDFLHSVTFHFYQKDSSNFSKEIIILLTHDRGAVRALANKLIDYIELHCKKFSLEGDILQLDELTQYKLWMSVLGSFKEPQKSLPMLMPLINSQFPIVQEAFICKLELLTEEYGGSVIEVLESNLDLNDLHSKAVLGRVREYDAVYNKELSKKNGIKELNPIHTQAKLLRLYSENHDKSFSKKTKDEVDKKSLFSQIATTVILAKSGGWKHEKHKQVSKLTQIGVSFQLPRSMFITPELVDWQFRLSLVEDWSNKFKEWEAIKSL